MKIVEVTIENTGNNLSAYIKDAPGIITVGNNIREINKNIREAIELYLEDNNSPNELFSGKYEIKFNMDIATFIELYGDIFTKAALGRITGINQRQLYHYGAKMHKPQKRQLQRMQLGIDAIIEELSMVRLV